MGGLKRGVLGLLALSAMVLGAPDNRGTEFVIGYMENNGVSINVELFVTTSRTTTVSVTVDSPKCTSPRVSSSFTVTAGQVKQLFISPSIRMAGSSKSSKGIRVKASDEVVIYGVNKETYSCDGFVGLPLDVLSDEYYLVTWSPTSRQCELLVVGVQDSTSVSITLSQHMGSNNLYYSGKYYYKGNKVTETLNKYDTWQLVTRGDLTGSYVKSSKPVSVFSGNRKTNIGRGGSSDHLVEQMFPVNTWGKNFATVPIPKRTVGDYFKFIASEDNTVVKITGGYTSTFTISKAGYMVQKLISSSAYCKIVADKPIMVVQFVQSQQSSSEKSDPAMMIIPPTEQYGADYTFTTPKYSLGSYNNYFMFIVEESQASGLRIDGKAFPTSTSYKKISGTSLVGGYISITEGTHTVRHTSPIAIFGGFLYGQANYETYGFTTGMRLAKVNAVCIPTPTVTGDGIDNDCDGKIDEELCTPENKNKDDDGDGKINEDCAKPPPVDGKWASWASYGACSVTCQPTSGTVSGTKTRTRSCSNPAPAYDGKQCVGSGSETVSCTPTNACRVDGNWGSWGSYGACSVTCASGTKSRSRSCNNPAPAGGGSNCVGSSTSSATCTLSACPIDGNWASWGSYGACSVTCAGGKQGRTRTCSNPAPKYGGSACSGSSSSSRSCNTHNCPINGNWASWGSYAACSVTCGGGRQSRTRTCTNPAPQYLGANCVGSSSSSRDCNTHNCPIDGNWASWGSYSACSVTCGGGKQGRTRTCSNPAPQYGGLACSGVSSSSQSCNIHNCPIDGNWASWGSYGACSVTCGGGRQSRTRTCTNPAPQYLGANCVGSTSSSQSCNTHNCPIDGNWASWGSYGACSVTCGGGRQSRTRTCTNPAPQYLGANCIGGSSSSQSCNTHNCPIDGIWASWGSYSTCTVTCGGGTQGRNRTCSSPAPQYGGKACSGSSSSSQSCNTHNCPIDGNWASWGSYAACSVTCGGGRQSRTRTCTNPAPQYLGANCVGSTSSSQSCNTHNCPIDGNWASWGSYSACSVTCGGGTQGRNRTCSNPVPQYGGKVCSGSSSSSQSCNTHNCPIDGNWASWGSYGACSVTCGGGRQSRTRTCTNPAPKYLGANCVGSTSSSQSCNTHNCPIDGNWASWGSYGACTVTCGGGTQGRTRTCSNPAPQYGGSACSGSPSSSRTCNTHYCPIDGNWASWGSYGACSVTCGGGSQSRNRTCTNPAPQYLGANCVGSTSSSQSCNTHNCPIDGSWASWGSWGTCTETCGGGIQSRTRSCNNPAPQYGGANCPGMSSSTQTCNTHNCPIDGVWSSWGSYGTCTVTCGGGTQTRSRSCSNPTPQYGGASCAGSTTSSQSCNSHNCPIDGGLTNWGSWGTCSVSCGGGTQVRTRSCTNPSPQYGGALCSGATSQNQTCNTQVCIIDGAWANWGAWGTCSVSCGGGKRSRARTCTDPKPANGGRECSGASSDLEDCNSAACPTPAAGAYVQLCPTGWFTCQSGGITCIDRAFICDCSADCDDGSDESTSYAGCSASIIETCAQSSSNHLAMSSLAFLLVVLAVLLNRGIDV
eukprot:XP_011444035.1 PREDICTED: SCO-spondin isoform X3 [Crassostrea gigas]